MTCTSDVHIAGSLKASGEIYLTNNCTIDGDGSTTEKLTTNSRAKIGSNVNVGRAMVLQKTVHIAGNINAGRSVSSIDGTPLDKLSAGGTVGGTIAQNAVVALDPSSKFDGESFASSKAGFMSLTWAAWLNASVRSNFAPSWSPASTPKPGGVLALLASMVRS